MIRNEISKFMALAPLIMPSLIRNSSAETEISDDSAILYFTLDEKLPIGLVMDSCDTDMELLMLFHATSKENPKLQHCCLFPVPKSNGPMFKINIETDDKGYADNLRVTIFDMSDIWEEALETDIAAHSHGYNFTQAISQSEVLSLFLKLA